MAYTNVKVPAGGAKISIKDGKLQVPDNPIIPFVEGDGTGRDIWRASVRVFDAAVDKAYKGRRKIHWMEVYAGEKSFKQFNSWLPDETIEAFKEFLVGIKGPLTTPGQTIPSTPSGESAEIPKSSRSPVDAPPR